MFLAEVCRATLVHVIGNFLLHTATKFQTFHLPVITLPGLLSLPSCEAGQGALVPRSASESSEY